MKRTGRGVRAAASFGLTEASSPRLSQCSGMCPRRIVDLVGLGDIACASVPECHPNHVVRLAVRPIRRFEARIALAATLG